MFKQVLNGRLVSIRQKNKLFKRPFFFWLTAVFNKVDYERIREVGPDRACAEWLMRNGAFVKWTDSDEYLKDYDVLMNIKETKYIEGVEADNSGITYLGFPYFNGCKHINEVKLIKCMYICNRALARLSYLEHSLCHLEVIDCGSITDEGLLSLRKLRNLKMLKLGGMPYLDDPEAVKKALIKAFPDTQIEFN